MQNPHIIVVDSPRPNAACLASVSPTHSALPTKMLVWVLALAEEARGRLWLDFIWLDFNRFYAGIIVES